MAKDNIEIGDYVLHETGYIGKIISLADGSGDDDYFEVIDEDGDNTSFAKSNAKFIDKKEAEERCVIFPNISQDHSASLVVKSNTLKVGCQRISFETIEKIYNAMKAVSEGK